MELNEMEKRMLYQTEGSERYAIRHELVMASRYAQNPDRKKAAARGWEDCWRNAGRGKAEIRR